MMIPVRLTASAVMLVVLLASPVDSEARVRSFHRCGFINLVTKEYTNQPNGAYVLLFRRHLSCARVRADYLGVDYDQTGKPIRPGYRCRVIATGEEFADNVCTSRAHPSRAFRWKTGA